MHTPTRLIQEFSAGDPAALNQLFVLIYDELYSLAQRQRNRWNGLDTLDTTALIHEVYLKLWSNQPDHIENRKHFFALAAKAMRQILINYAEKRFATKRGGELEKVPIDHVELATDDNASEDLLAMHHALSRLEKIDERRSKVFECRFFGGMTVEDTAFVLEISPATVKRDWQAACGWVYEEMMG